MARPGSPTATSAEARPSLPARRCGQTAGPERRAARGGQGSSLVETSLTGGMPRTLAILAALVLCPAAAATGDHASIAAACPPTLANQLADTGSARQLITVVTQRRSATTGAPPARGATRGGAAP